MRRRKSPKVVWLPLDAGNAVGSTDSSIFDTVVTPDVSAVGNSVTVEVPLVNDFVNQRMGGPNVNSLSDIENSAYRLRRIVGKIYTVLQINPGGVPGAPLIAITAGIIVRRMDETSGISLAITAGTISPDSRDNTGDPWIWRRTWLIGDVTGSNSPVNADNWSFGPSALDGPHVDQKTARIIAQEERLFLDFSTRVIVPAPNAGTVQPIAFIGDLRCLGSMRPGVGNRRNASR